MLFGFKYAFWKFQSKETVGIVRDECDQDSTWRIAQYFSCRKAGIICLFFETLLWLYCYSNCSHSCSGFSNWFHLLL